jgi:hypothetical protein
MFTGGFYNGVVGVMIGQAFIKAAGECVCGNFELFYCCDR